MCWKNLCQRKVKIQKQPGSYRLDWSSGIGFKSVDNIALLLYSHFSFISATYIAQDLIFNLWNTTSPLLNLIPISIWIIHFCPSHPNYEQLNEYQCYYNTIITIYCRNDIVTYKWILHTCFSISTSASSSWVWSDVIVSSDFWWSSLCFFKTGTRSSISWNKSLNA